MTIHQDEIIIHTDRHGAMHDLTGAINGIVERADIAVGTVHVFNVGSTGAIGTIEFESGLLEDLPNVMDRLFPPNRDYGHEQAWHDGNGHSHLQATTLGPEITVPIREGKMVLGTWQQVFHLECDTRARQRTIMVTVIGA